ncbi:DUF2163 domain-containing protein, partial [Delftia tsuruhatensis]
MKARSPELALAQSAQTTTLAWCMRITARDGTVLARSSVDVRVVVDGVAYDPVDGFSPFAIQQSADLAVQNSEVVGFLLSQGIDEADILGGRWDGAAVLLFEADYTNPAAGGMILQSGTLGNLSTARLTYSAEFRGLAQALQQTVGRVYAKGCDATFGDARCKVDAQALKVFGTVTAVTDRRSFRDTSRAEIEDYFGAGLVTWTSGANDGYSMEVSSFAPGGTFVLSLPMPSNIAVGDTYEAIPGCRKR